MTMRRWKLFIAGAALATGLAHVIACSSDARDDGFVEQPDGGDATASLPPEQVPSEDAGAPDDAGEDAAPPPAFDPSDEPVVCDAGPCATRLAAGDRHVCALMNDGTVRCWGDNTKGAVGLEAVADAGEPDAGPVDAGVRPGIAPRTVADIVQATQVSAGDDVTCALLAGGTAKCWGANDVGQLGLSSTAPKSDKLAHPIPSVVDVTDPVTRIDVGHGSVCARRSDSAWSCWGSNTQRQLLSGSTATFGGPALANLGGLSVTRTTSGDTTIYGITEDARLFSWGLVSGRDTSFSQDPAPKENPHLANIVDIAAGPAQVDGNGVATFHTCVITTAARVYCWGARLANELPALCTGVPNDQRTPTSAPVQPAEKGAASPQQIAAGRLSTCVRLTDGSIQCCGDDTRGQMGTGSIADPPAVLSFTPAKALQGYAVQVVTTRFSTCALLRDGSVACWGGNKFGELGQGTVDNDPHPTPVKVPL
jgi:alpha-tubulin suppressor-like RCC1 family protein